MTWSLKKKLLFLTALVTIVLVGWYVTHPLGVALTIRGQKFNVELAVTPREREQGLSARVALGENQGMLFVFDHEEQYGFWMKGMRFPLDFIWIAGGHVADITENVPPPKDENEQLASYQPIVSVDKILEVNAGTIDRLGIKVGDKVDITN